MEIENEIEIIDDEYELSRRRMRELYRMSLILLTKPERLILYKVLKDYRFKRDLVRLILGLNVLLRTYSKVELLKHIRYFVWEGHIRHFDRYTKFHQKFRRRRPHDIRSLSNMSKFSTLNSNTSRNLAGISKSTTNSRSLNLLTVPVPITGDGRSIASTSTNPSTSRQLKDVRVFTLQRDVGEPSLGFSVRGGAEHGLSVYISDIDADSAAERSGLLVGDKILEANNISLKSTASSTAVKVLTGSRKLKLVVQRTHKVPEWRLSREKTIDQGGLADKSGVRVGDQIIDVNGIPFDNITHAHAVEVLKDKKHLILTLRDVGRFPVYKELYAEYTWSDGQLKAATSTTSLRDIHVVHSEMTTKSPSVADIFSASRLPSALQNDIFLPNQKMENKLKDDVNDIEDNRNIDSDNDSLMDLDQWASEIRSTSSNGNHSFESDVMYERVKVVVNHDRAAAVRRIETQNAVNDDEYPDRNTHASDDSDDYNDANPDMIYAKIGKRDPRYTSTSNITDDTEMNNHSCSNQHERTDSLNSSHGQSQVSSHKSNESRHLTENRIAMTKQEERIETASITGSLYSKVRRLSGGSFKNLADTSLSVYTSPNSLADPYSDDESPSLTSKDNEGNLSVHEATTLQIRRPSVSFQEPNLDSDTDSDKEQIYTVTGDIKRVNDDNAKDITEYDLADGTEYTHRTNEQGTDGEKYDLQTLEVKLQALKTRQENIGLQEVETLAPKGENETGHQKMGTWKAIKKKIKGSLRIKSPIEASSSHRKTGVKSRIDQMNMATLEEEAQKLLNQDEFNAVLRHVKAYHDSCDLERLVDVLVALLDTPEKVMLLKDVRGVLYQHDTVQYDNLVNRYEIEAYQKLSLKLHLPLHHRHNTKPRKTLITTEMENCQKEDESTPGEGIEFEEHVVNGEREVKVVRIDKHGAANDDSTIAVGMVLLGVDRQRVEGWTKDEVLAVIERMN
ncbi:PDZD7-like protein [Mya arenaria]|uniref:PDZD7-like protein n=1 Tax=Mya arenaria TaxID=6604 RepID=A0ABY7FMG8_MYAAR|nr:PDZD7-like protein [Mya arenaria]